MKQTINLKLSALAVVAGFLLITAAPVYAHDGEDDSSDSGSSKVETERQSTTGRKSAFRTEVKQEVETETSGDDTPHKRGALLVAELRKEHKAQSAEARQKKCQSRKQGLSNKFDRIAANSQRIQDRISGILDKAVQYQQDKNLTIDAGLVPAAQTAKTTSADSISALLAVKPSLDCNNVSVADDVATFKAAAQTTRDNLKAYRDAVKAVLKALKEAKSAGAEGSDQ